jgi:tRNA threonylcarbamoyladenosine biosynthesis protein TsaB
VGWDSAQTGETPYILSLETATRAGSIALTKGASVLASLPGEAQESHSVSLLHNIETLLKQAGVTLSEVDLFASAVGPGSFTGLRIGLATTKALAHTLHRPCFGVQTLHAVAHAAGASDLTCALLPAGRGEFFAQLFRVESDNAVLFLSEPEHIAPEHLFERMGKMRSLRWAGAGAHLLKNKIKERALALDINFRDEESEGSVTTEAKGLWTLAPASDLLAENVALLALQQWLSGEMLAPQDLRAIYVRPSDAELNK